MAYCDYEHCPVCDAAFDAARLKSPQGSLEWHNDYPFHGYKILYMGDRETPNGLVVLCEKHALALKPHIDALIKEAKSQEPA